MMLICIENIDLMTLPVICLCITVGQSAHHFMRLGPTPNKRTCSKKQAENFNRHNNL